MYEAEFREYYALHYEHRQDHQYRLKKKFIRKIVNTLQNILLVTKTSINSRNVKKQILLNEIEEYFLDSCLDKTKNVLEAGQKIIFLYFTLIQMTKDVLSISVFDVDVEKLFFLIRDVIDYRRNRLHEQIIENIMIFKKELQIAKKYSREKISAEDDEVSKKLLNQTTQGINEDIDDVDDNAADDENIDDENDANDIDVIADSNIDVDANLNIDIVADSNIDVVANSNIVVISRFFVLIVLPVNPSVDYSALNDDDDDEDLSKYSKRLRRSVIKDNSKRKKISMTYAGEDKKKKAGVI